MLTPDSPAPVDMATDLTIPVIVARGLPGVTPRVIGEAVGCSRQAVHQWFGSASELQWVVASRFAARWNGGRRGRRREPRLAELVTHARSQERGLVRCALGLRGSLPGAADQATLSHALLEGLRRHLADGAPSLTWEEAAAVLDRGTGGRVGPAHEPLGQGASRTSSTRRRVSASSAASGISTGGRSPTATT